MQTILNGFAPTRPNIPVRQGYTPLYHNDVVNHCPACGHTHWHIGRSVAECAFCETALPLAMSSSAPVRPSFRLHGVQTAQAA